MEAPPNLALPRQLEPARDIFAGQGDEDEGRCFLMIGAAISNLLEDLPADERNGLYMEEIPMGRAVLYDMEKVHTQFPPEKAMNLSFRPNAQRWRPPEGTWVVLYEKPVPSTDTKYGGADRFHYRERLNTAMDDARHLARAWGQKIAVAKVLRLTDWH